MKNPSLTKVLYFIGLLVAVLMGLGKAMGSKNLAENMWLVFILVVVGLIIGFYNISKKEVTSFFIATVALILSSAVANFAVLDKLIPKLGTFVDAALSNFVIMAGVAAVVVAFKAVYSMAK